MENIIRKVKKESVPVKKVKKVSIKTKAKRLAKEGLNTKEIAHELRINKYDASKMIKG